MHVPLKSFTVQQLEQPLDNARSLLIDLSYFLSEPDLGI